MMESFSDLVNIFSEQVKKWNLSSHIGPQPPRIMAAALDKKNFLFIDVDDDGPNFLPLFSLWGSCFLSSSRAQPKSLEIRSAVFIESSIKFDEWQF